MSTPSTVMDMLPSLQDAGKRLVDAGELYNAFQFIFGAQPGIAGGTVAPGPTLTVAINQIVSGTFVRLPLSISGRQVTVMNQSPNALFVSAQARNPANNNQPDTINGASNVGQASGTTAVYVCCAIGQWVQIGGTGAPPAGATGATGPTGPTGATGPTGP